MAGRHRMREPGQIPVRLTQGLGFVPRELPGPPTTRSRAAPCPRVLGPGLCPSEQALHPGES